jgi:CBS domain-containing protein
MSMALLVSEVMNREIFTVSAEMPAQAVLERLLALGISVAPVVNEKQEVMGLIALRDLVDIADHHIARERMSTPAVMVAPQETLEQASSLLAQTGFHHVVVIDEKGRAIGFLSAIDLLRGLIGLPARHPATFPHFDEHTGLRWTDDTLFNFEHIHHAPDGPGVLVLIHGGVGIAESVAWVDSIPNIRAGLIRMLATLPAEQSQLAGWLKRGQLRFRAAPVDEPERAQRAVAALRATDRSTARTTDRATDRASVRRLAYS